MTVEVGSPAPDFTLKDQDNQDVTLSALRGRNVVLVFYPLAFSPVCTGELRDISRSADRYRAAGAEVLGISVDSRWTLRAFKEHEGLEARLLADFNPKGEVARRYGAYIEEAGIATRATFVIDRDGRVVERVVTSPAEARDQEEYLTALAACPV